MAHMLIVAFSMIAAAPPGPNSIPPPVSAIASPLEGADTKYCMRVEALIGTLVETVRCWTRQQWAEQGVDVDNQWAKEGVRIKK